MKATGDSPRETMTLMQDELARRQLHTAASERASGGAAQAYLAPLLAKLASALPKLRQASSLVPLGLRRNVPSSPRTTLLEQEPLAKHPLASLLSSQLAPSTIKSIPSSISRRRRRAAKRPGLWREQKRLFVCVWGELRGRWTLLQVAVLLLVSALCVLCPLADFVSRHTHSTWAATTDRFFSLGLSSAPSPGANPSRSPQKTRKSITGLWQRPELNLIWSSGGQKQENSRSAQTLRLLSALTSLLIPCAICAD